MVPVKVMKRTSWLNILHQMIKRSAEKRWPAAKCLAEEFKNDIFKRRIADGLVANAEEELAMIKSVIVQQQEVWNLFYQDLEKRIDNDKWDQIPKFLRRIQKIDEDAERVEKWILVQLDLKAKHVALKESHNSTTLSTAVIGFTIITVIFTPLSFISSLFALPIDQLQHQQYNGSGGSNAYPSRFIGKWMSTFNSIMNFVILTI
jgi:CorA-like Mg2+ transporter protein